MIPTGLFRGLGLDIVDPVIFARQPDPGKDLFGLVLEPNIATKVGIQVGLQLGPPPRAYLGSGGRNWCTGGGGLHTAPDTPSIEA